MTEYEKKVLLTKEEYESFLEFFGYDKSFEQINYYFDTDDLSMNMQDITCRIRFKDGRYKGTIKKHISNKEQSEETEINIQNGIYENEFIDSGLKLQGLLVTKRHIIWEVFGCEVVLDKNEYLGYTDYELEIEYLSECEKQAKFIFELFLMILVRHKFTAVQAYKVPSKSSRFFEKKLKEIKLKKSFNSNRDNSCQD